jgi:acetyl-CoA carboxylase biotin carboxyl carrier protein
MNLKEIKRLITVIEESNISHFSIEEDGTKIEIKKENCVPLSTSSIVIPQQQSPPVNTVPAAVPVTDETSDAIPEGLTAINSQMVGTFYASPSPESAPFVKIGDTISDGHIICVIEAMKLFNEIESEVAGVIEKVCVKNGDPVEFGQPLFLVR